MGQEHLQQFKQRRKMEENMLRMIAMKDLRDEVVRDVIN